ALRAGETYGGEFKATVAVRQGGEAIAVWPGFKDRVYGIAVDVGTTTIAGHLCALDTGEVLASSGMMNPQIRFGEDLMSRVSYVQQNEGSAPDL
ncbi:MAG: drug:proton antiporter, partial [Akkermansiaceae bacterium]|nr:drug:proton antiporter [Akkermansiaceae bacterium]